MLNRVPFVACALVLAVVPAATLRAEIPFGAQTMDQSTYALGTMQLNVVFLESDGSIDVNQEDWTASQLTLLRGEIDEAVDFWEGLTASLHPAARLSIDVHYAGGGVPLATGYEPITRSHTQDRLWINEAMEQLGYDSSSHFTNVRDFNEQSRIDAGTNWASTIFIVNDLVDEDNRFSSNLFAYAQIGGPYAVFTYENNGWRPDRFNHVLSHEMGHLFFALDEYEESGARNSERSGYLSGVNGNAERDASGTPVEAPYPDALMLNNTLVPSPFTLVQVGILDTDGDSVPDVLDTTPLISGDAAASDAETGTFVFDGSARVNPLNNLNRNKIGFSNSLSDITINTIAGAEYRLDEGPWVGFAAADGAYGEYDEALSLVLEFLPWGPHSIEVRAVNSVDNVSDALAFQFESLRHVPEPATWLLAGVGAAVGAARRRRNGTNSS